MSTDTTTRAPADRSAALDRLRGAALVAMVVHHLTDWLTGDARAVLPGWPSFVVTDVAAVAFFVAAGASMALFVASRRGRRMSRGRVAAQVLRRYGLLVPIGLALDWLLWRSPTMFGVLEALGVCVVLGAAVAAAVPTRLLPAVAGATLVAGIVVERLAGGSGAWLAREVLAGKFPVVTYLGFVLVGVAAARTGRYRDPRWVARVTLAAVAATVALVAAGLVPDRYPGDVRFVVPGLAGTAAVYALGRLPWHRALAALDRVLRRAASHTLGIFVAHYVLYAAFRHTGVLGTVPGAVAVPAAVATSVTACLLAPRVPQPPWSLRTGFRSVRPPARQGPAPTPAAPGPRGAAGRGPEPAPAGRDPGARCPATIR
jgi:uncharacterized membrane protein